jgi:hypothetical protein
MWEVRMAKVQSAKVKQVVAPAAANTEVRTKRQLVVVVHGVGVKEAGVSADLLATALEDVPDGHGDASLRSFEGHTLRPHSSDDFHLREFEIYNSGGKRQVFPARIRRYRNNDESGKLVAERVVADFYWGDISNIASGIAGLFLGILKTILGLCHVVRESAWSVFPGDGFNWFIRKMANAAALTIHGPIAAINVVLLAGVLIHAVIVGQFGWPVLAAAWTTVAMTAICGILVARSSDVYLTRWFAQWTAIVALVLALLLIFMPVAMSPIAPNPPPADAPAEVLAAFDAKGLETSPVVLNDAETALLTHVCAVPAAATSTVSGTCVHAYDQFYLQGLRILGIMGLAWMLVIVCNAVVAAAEVYRWLIGRGDGPPALASASIALMSMLWIILIAGIWASILNLPFQSLPTGLRLESILGTASFAVIALGFIALGAGYVFLRTGRWGAKSNPADYIKSVDPEHARKIAERNRLLISPWMLVPIWAFFAVMLITSLSATLRMIGIGLPVPGWAAAINYWLQANFGSIMAGLAIVGGFLFAAGQQQLRAGLGIAIDVITWLNDHSWNSLEMRTEETRTLAEAMVPGPLQAGSGQKAQGYWRRERIKNRLKVMMEKLLRDEKPDEVIFVSHSQGTVVAIATLDEKAPEWLESLGKNASMKLVTMGSPYAHVHRHYYPRSFAAIGSMGALTKAADGGVLDDWINIFRIDDFVGTFIDPSGQWPREHPVPANGHTYYWVDENVFPILKKFVS